MTASLGFPLNAGTQEAPAPAGKSEFNGTVRVRGLKTPNDVAWNPLNGELYVVEKGANRIVAIRNNSPTPVIESAWAVEPGYPRWLLSKTRTREILERPALDRPECLAFATNGHLFVVEGTPRGRVLEFIPDENGRYTKAQLIGVPWLDRAYVWDDIEVADDGRLFICGIDSEGRAGLTLGVVLMRDEKGDWWVVDYGPFSSFSGMVLNRRQDVVVISERPEGGVVWWDAIRHLPIGVANGITPQSQVESVSLLSDGSIVLAQRATNKGKDARVLRLNPTDGRVTQVVDGYDSLGGMMLHPETGNLFITDPQGGLLVECAPKEPLPAGEYLIQRSLEGYEVATGFTPRTSPEFLRSFFSKADVNLSEPTQKGSAYGRDGGEGGAGMKAAVTLRDFASRLPLVAGRVKVIDSDREDEEDPVSDVSFVLLFPGRVLLGGEHASPSLCYFTATRKSGKVEQTRELFQGMSMNHFSREDGWTKLDGQASLTIPIVTCGMQKREEGLEVNLVFLGMGVYDDYYLSLISGADDTGTMIVDGLKGGRTVYRTTFREVVQGGNEVKNLVVAGFDPKEKIGVGWFNIGQAPLSASVGVGETRVGTFQGVGDELARLIERKQMEWRVLAVRPEMEGEENATGEPAMEATTPPPETTAEPEATTEPAP